MNPALMVSLSCLLILSVQGHHDNTSSRCKCSNGYIGRFHPKIMKGEPVVHLPSIFCQQTEIIITTTADKEKCVNPESPIGQHIVRNWKHRQNGAVRTTASSQGNTVDSTAVSTAHPSCRPLPLH